MLSELLWSLARPLPLKGTHQHTNHVPLWASLHFRKPVELSFNISHHSACPKLCLAKFQTVQHKTPTSCSQSSSHDWSRKGRSRVGDAYNESFVSHFPPPPWLDSRRASPPLPFARLPRPAIQISKWQETVNMTTATKWEDDKVGLVGRDKQKRNEMFPARMNHAVMWWRRQYFAATQTWHTQ